MHRQPQVIRGKPGTKAAGANRLTLCETAHKIGAKGSLEEDPLEALSQREPRKMVPVKGLTARAAALRAEEILLKQKCRWHRMF
eukprot:3136366-Amphidinium_carterae.1